MHRFFYAGELALGQPVLLDDRSVQHAIALRLKPEEPVALFNGEGGVFYATLRPIKKRIFEALPYEFVAQERESPLRIELVQAISRGEKMDFTIQKAVELGVDAIQPIFTERCGVKLTSTRAVKKQRHWQQIILSACEQCGRNQIPTIAMPLELSAWLPLASLQAGVKLFLHPTTEPPQHPKQLDANLTVVVGSEGGFTAQEADALVTAGFLGWRLGPRILRTETAALVALTQFQTLWGDLAI